MNEVQVIRTDIHPLSLAAVRRITVVSTPVFQLVDDLGTLVRATRFRPRGVEAQQSFAALRKAFQTTDTVALPPEQDPFRVTNVQIPSSWVTDYKLHADKAQQTFVGLIHFGPNHFSAAHFEECAAATYGCLLEGSKTWEFVRSGHVIATVQQQAGETIYVPPGLAHQVTTTSNGAILIGETEIVWGSVRAFTQNMASLQHGEYGGVHIDPEPEAQQICDSQDIHISKRQQRRAGTRGASGCSGPASTTLARLDAIGAGGTNVKDAGGKKRRRRICSTRHQKRVKKRKEQTRQLQLLRQEQE